MRNMKHVLLVITLSILVSAHARETLTDQDAAELTAVFTSLQNVLDLSYEVERYAISHGKLPRAASPAELSKLLMGTDSAAAYFVDGWGKPLRLDSDPDRGSYTIAGTGVELRDGVLVRSREGWALARLKAAHFDKAKALEISLEKNKAARTAADMMALNTAIASFEQEQQRFPSTYTLDSLARDLEPKYISAMPRRDAWGNPFSVQITEGTKMVRIIAVGADGKFDVTRWSEKTKTTDYTRDLVLINNQFEGPWDTKPAGAELVTAYTAYESFKMKLAMLRESSPEQRASMRAQGLIAEMDAALDGDDWRTAIAKYDEAIQRNPRFQDAKLLDRLVTTLRPVVKDKGNAEARAADERAAAWLTDIAKTSAEPWDPTKTLVDLYCDLEDWDRVGSTLDRYLSAHPQDLRAHYLRMLLLFDRKPPESFVASLKTAVGGVGRDTETALRVAHTAMSGASSAKTAMPRNTYQALSQGALDVARRAAEVEPQNGDAWMSVWAIAKQVADDDPDAPQAAKYRAEAESARVKWREVREKEGR